MNFIYDLIILLILCCHLSDLSGITGTMLAVSHTALTIIWGLWQEVEGDGRLVGLTGGGRWTPKMVGSG